MLPSFLGEMDATAATNPLLDSTNLLLATIDADIDSIPDDQFGLVFAGGIVRIRIYLFAPWALTGLHCFALVDP